MKSSMKRERRFRSNCDKTTADYEIDAHGYCFTESKRSVALEVTAVLTCKGTSLER